MQPGLGNYQHATQTSAEPPPPPVSPIAHVLGLAGDSPDGLGQNYATRRTRGPGSGLEHVPLYTNGTSPFGQADTTGLAVDVMGLIVRAGAGAVVGMALAPTHEQRTMYAITGAALSAVFGTLGMLGQATFVLLTEQS